MNELDRFWSTELARIAENARQTGRSGVADYLELKARNDTIRSIGVRWLMDSVVETAIMEQGPRRQITIEREDPHRFDLRGASMSGSLVRLRLGVRCLTVEAGWTRTPSDGFMKGGALAAARITHFGMPQANSQIGLFAGDTAPAWRYFPEGGSPVEFSLVELEKHFQFFLA